MAVTSFALQSAFAADIPDGYSQVTISDMSEFKANEQQSTAYIAKSDLVLKSNTAIVSLDTWPTTHWFVTSESDVSGKPLYSFKLQNNEYSEIFHGYGEPGDGSYMPEQYVALLSLKSFEANRMNSFDITGNKINREQNTSWHTIDSGFLYSQDTRVSSNETVNVCNNSIAYASVGTQSVVRGVALGGFVRFSDNTTIIHENNTSTAESDAGYITADGGVFYGSGISYTDNGDIRISNNGVSAKGAGSNMLAQGGALSSVAGISTSGPVYGVSFNNNGEIHIFGNYAEIDFTGDDSSKVSSTVRGGAIYAPKGKVHIRNNDDVIFEKNYIVKNGDYRLQSIFAEDGSIYSHTQSVEFSAENGKKIEFRDSIYVDADLETTAFGKIYASSFNLNSQYTDADGNTIAQTGDIVITGEYAEQHLNEILAARGENRTATAAEILASQTSEVLGTAKLHDGRLMVKNGAVLKADALEVLSSASGQSSPTLVLEGATLSAKSLTFAAGTQLVLSGVDNEGDSMITVSESLTMSDTVLLELSDTYTGDSLKIAVAGYTGTEDDWLTLQNSTSFTVDSLIWDAGNLGWKEENGTLYVAGSMQKKDVVDISNTDMTLDSENALGSDKDTPVVTTGTTTIGTTEGVTVILPGTIQNGGDLTISGSYDGSTLDTIVVEDTRVCVDGKEGNNGFYREGGSAILVVDNKGNATLTVDDGTTVKSKDGESLKLYANGLAAGELNYSNYHIEDGNHSAAMSEIQGMRPDSTADLTITMTDGELVADADATDVQSSGGTIMTQGEVEVSGKLSGSTSVVVTGESEATISGDNDYTGDTIISGDKAKLTVGEDNALGKGKVQLHDKGTLDLNGKAIANDINVTGCELHNASAYTGNIDVSGNLTICGTDATAGKVTLINGGTIAPEGTETLTLGTLEVAAGASARDQIAAGTTVTDSLVLNDGAVLTMSGSLTMVNGTTIVLQGKGYRSGQIIVTSGAGSDLGGTTVTMHNGKVAYTLLGDNQVQLTAVFNQDTAEALTVSNWGIATASRTFVNAVRGQRTNAGCIANGRGTAWAAVLGGTSGIGNGDIDLKGAAVGADMKVGEKSSVGVAVGYIDGDAKIPGLSKAEQEGTYVALYGEHGLKKLSPTSCLSLDWVAAYGQTETEWNGMDWEQQSLQLNTRLNWNKKVTDRLCMSVFGGLEYFASESDRVENAKTGSIQNLRGEIGVGARYVAWGTPGTVASYDEKGALVTAYRPGCEKLVLHGEIRYMNDMVRSNPVIEQDGLRGSGDNPGRQGMGIEAGATYRIGERWSASANYGFNTMDDSREHRVNVGASYTF